VVLTDEDDLLGERIFSRRESGFIAIVKDIGQVDSTIYRGFETRPNKRMKRRGFSVVCVFMQGCS
jgi:hypothetical protein